MKVTRMQLRKIILNEINRKSKQCVGDDDPAVRALYNRFKNFGRSGDLPDGFSVSETDEMLTDPDVAKHLGPPLFHLDVPSLEGVRHLVSGGPTRYTKARLDQFLKLVTKKPLKNFKKYI